MAIISCPECGKQISDRAISCPDCGCPINAAPAASVQESPKDNIANLRKLAERAKEDNDSEMAAKYYEQLLLECPDDWEARFYTTYYAAHNIKIAQIGSAAVKVSNIIGPTLQMIKESDDETNKISAYIQVATDVISFSTMLFNNITSNLGSSADIVRKNLDNWAVPTATMLVVLGDELRAKFPGEATDALALKVYEAAYNYSDSFRTWTTSCGSLHTRIVGRKNQVSNEIKARENKRKAEEKARIEKQKEEARKAYWAAHAEEYQKLQEDMQAHKKTIEELKQQQDAIGDNAQKEEAPMKAKIEELTNQKNSLGIFKGKEKKALQAQIDELETQRRDIQTKAASDRMKLDDQIRKLKAEINNIEKEFKKDR